MVFSLTLLIPVAVDFLYEHSETGEFVQSLGIAFLAGTLLWWPVRYARPELKNRDGFLIAVLFWVVLSAFAALPFFLHDDVWPSYTSALFEALSGLTTTGATAVPRGNIDLLPHALLWYRAQLHWLGGLGIIVLAVAVLPMLGIGGMQLARAEAPGPMKDARLTSRLIGAARALWTVYVLLTLACLLGYWGLGMPLFDALCNAMSTLATGGFATHSASLGYYNSAGIETIAILFMLFGASNFALHYLAWRDRSLRIYLRDTEFRVFIGIVLAMGALVCAPLYLGGIYPDLGSAIRKGLFQLVSYGTNSGFSTADPSLWPGYVPMLLVLASFMMSCSGGTGGGVKVIRLVLFVKQAAREMKRLVHPSAEVAIKLEGKIVPNDVVYAIGGFFSVYIGFTVALSFLMMMTGLDPVSAFSAVAACINNAGRGLYSVYDTVAGVSDFGKWVLMFAMLLGRLEIFTLLIVFTPTFWRR
ncbi:MAG: potassium transporter [Nevskiaceae bacterium]|nr:MAG: potassium transporter [Nevskiaceae bacterium]